MSDYKDKNFTGFPSNGNVVILDLEFTSWEGSMQRNWSKNWEHREIVQIGAVLVDLDSNFQVIDQFNCLVRPTINPYLSDYFVELTGIDRYEVKSKGISFPNAYVKFLEFASSSSTIYANGNDGEVLRENCRLSQIDYKLEKDKVVNFRIWLAKQVSEYLGKKYEYVDSGDIIYVLTNKMSNKKKHNALDDAICLSEAVKILLNNHSF
jgi:inhibitor of KinA sporulation pathway (predicted exonuclease)